MAAVPDRIYPFHRIDPFHRIYPSTASVPRQRPLPSAEGRLLAPLQPNVVGPVFGLQMLLAALIDPF